MHKITVGLLFSSLMLMLPAVNAIDVGEITSIMHPGEHIHAKEITNTNNTARYIQLNVVRISSPLPGGVEIPMESKGELLSTPASLVLPGQAKDVFRLIYKGPEDNKERYYRLQWLDEPLADNSRNTASKYGVATTSAEIGTILVVAPRKEDFKYSFKNGSVTNEGNTSFRIIAHGECLKKMEDQDSCRERYYVMPGMSKKLNYVNLSSAKSHVGIWRGKTFISIK